MQFEDKRTKKTLSIDDLSSSEKESYRQAVTYMNKPRRCSLCGLRFLLADTLGLMCKQHMFRDHVDYDSERPDMLRKLTLDTNVYSVLASSIPKITHIDNVKFIGDGTGAFREVTVSREDLRLLEKIGRLCG